LAAVIAWSFLVPASVSLVVDSEAEPSVSAEYYNVLFDGALDEPALKASAGIEIVKVASWGAVVKSSASVRGELSNRFSTTDMAGRTQVRLDEQGITFDSRTGYDVPDGWKSHGSQLYLVQFVAPFETSWVEDVRGRSSAFFDTIGDNLAVVKLSPGQKAAVESLPTVEWVGTYEPYYKVYQDARERTGTFSIKATPIGTSLEQLAGAMSSVGAWNVSINDGCNMVEASVNEAVLPAVASLESVGLVQYLPLMTQQASLTSEFVGAHTVWDTSRSNLPQSICGQGQVYQHQDLDLDAAHPDFASGALGNRVLYNDGSTDGSGHSTNCVGIAAGNGYCMEGFLGLDNMNRNYYELSATNPYGYLDRAGMAGRAPEASIVLYDGLVTSEWDNGYTTYGARIFSNSFGPTTVTNGYVSDVDSFMLSYPQGLVFFSACNYGPNQMTISGNANCKLGLGVGAAENVRLDWFFMDDNPYSLWTGSCKGPVSATDLRVKPDVVEYGAGLIMPQSSAMGNGDNSLYRGANNDATISVDDNGDGDCDYVKNQGTSFSCPAAAGDAILIRDWLQDVEGVATPDPMLIKAYMIEGAQDMGYGYPSYGQGWGMCNVEYSICPPAPLTNKRFTGTGTATNYVNVATAGAPLKITMCQWDTSTSSAVLSTDYDLVAISPSGKRYEGNAFKESQSVAMTAPGQWSTCAFPTWAQTDGIGYGAYDWDTANDGGDDINTVEVVLLSSPEKGNWTIQVVAKSGAGPAWYVVASADFSPVKAYNVELTPDAPLVYSQADGYGTAMYQATPGDTVSVGFTTYNYATSGDTITLAATRQDYGYAAGSPLPTGWSVAYDTGASLSMAAGDVKHVVARVTTSGTAAAGSYVIKILGSSTGSATAKDFILFNVDIVTQRLPNRVRATSHNLSDSQPGIAAYNNSGTKYVVAAYCHDTGMGDRVWASVSSDGGLTFGSPIQITHIADDPCYLQIKCAPVGHDRAGRMFIGYNGMNPLVDGDDWAQVSNRRAVVCFADPPYTSWTTVVVFANGAGPGTYNDYREIDIGFWVNPAGADEVHFIEVNYFNSQNDMNNAWSSISPAERVSTDGGTTWPTTTALSVGGSNQYGVGCNNDQSGDLIMTCYMTGTDRMMYYRRYSGTWQTAVVAMTFAPDDAMWGYGAGDPTQDRYYVVAGKCNGNNYNAFKLPSVDYTANNGGSFSTPVSLGGASNWVTNGHFDSLNMMDMDVTADGYAWFTAKQIPHNFQALNPYKADNWWCAGSTAASAFATYSQYNWTRDSIPKEHFRTTALGNTLYVGYNPYNTGHSDVYLMQAQQGWMTAADTLGPETLNVNAPSYWNKAYPLTISAVADETHRGMSTIAASQYRWDSGMAIAMAAADGTFNGEVEGVAATSTVSGLTEGRHYLEVRSQDSGSRWGEWTGIWVIFYDVTVPDEPIFAGVQSVTNPGTGTSLTLSWIAGSDPNLNEFPLKYYVYRSISSGFTPGAGNLISSAPTSTIGQAGSTMFWNDTTVVGGTTYYYIVRCEDAGGVAPTTTPLMEANTVEKSATPESLVWFQVQSPFAGYRNLNTDSFETAVQTVASATLSAAGEYQVGQKWISATIPSAQSAVGTWNFYAYGSMNYNRATGNMYAKVYVNGSSPTLLFTTGYDDENVGLYTTTHMYSWSYAASSGTLSAGSRYYVELWLHVTATTGGPQVVTYDYSGTHTGRTAYVVDGNEAPVVTENSRTELTATQYTQIGARDDTRYTSLDPNSGDYVSIRCSMDLPVGPTQVSAIQLYWEGYASRAANMNLYAWNSAATTWTQVASTAVRTAAPDGSVTGALSGVTWTDYITGATNTFVWCAQYMIADTGMGTTTTMTTDYMCANVTQLTGTPDGVFTFSYDNAGTPSAVHRPAVAASGAWFNITGIVAGWNFVSVPIVGTTTLPAALTDIAGAPLVAWTRVMWYNPSTPVDPWKQYYTTWNPALNDLTSVNNKVGVWLYVTNAADGILNLGGMAYSRPTTTSIEMKAGWNLVSFPSDDTTYTVASLKVDAGAGVVDLVEGYSGVATYLTVTLADGTALAAGKAYWVHCTADWTWNKAW